MLLCPSCGLLFVGSPITSEQLAHAYRTIDNVKYYEDTAAASAARVHAAAANINSIIEKLPAGPAILDVGCGDGHLLEALSKSFPTARLAGHELPGQAAAAAQARGFTVYTGELAEVPSQFHVAVLLDVAEHVPDPNRFFQTLASRLETKGYVYFHTPRRCFWDTAALLLARTPGVRKLALAWLNTRVSIFHLHLFTDEALTRCLEQAGFQVQFLRKKLELSWPLEMYTRVYLGNKLHLPSPLVVLATWAAKFIFIRLGALHNKAVCLAQKKG